MRALRRSIAALILGVGCIAAPSTGAAAPRTLDEIAIEGELRLPQLLFITSRESHRPLDWLDHYAAPAAVDVARAAPLPRRIDVIPSSDPAEDERENLPPPAVPSSAPQPPTASRDPAKSTKE